MDLSNATSKDIQELYRGKEWSRLSDDDKLEVGKWISEYMQRGVSEEDKVMFGPLGIGESVGMTTNYIMGMRSVMCRTCKNCIDKECVVYDEDIPEEIWPGENRTDCRHYEPAD